MTRNQKQGILFFLNKKIIICRKYKYGFDKKVSRARNGEKMNQEQETKYKQSIASNQDKGIENKQPRNKNQGHGIKIMESKKG